MSIEHTVSGRFALGLVVLLLADPPPRRGTVKLGEGGGGSGLRPPPMKTLAPHVLTGGVSRPSHKG